VNYVEILLGKMLKILRIRTRRRLFWLLFGKYKEKKWWGNPAHGVWSDLEVCKIYGAFLRRDAY